MKNLFCKIYIHPLNVLTSQSRHHFAFPRKMPGHVFASIGRSGDFISGHFFLRHFLHISSFPLSSISRESRGGSRSLRRLPVLRRSPSKAEPLSIQLRPI